MQHDQQKYHNEQLKLMLKNNKVDIKEAEKSIKRKNKAHELISSLMKKRSTWFYKKTLESLYGFLDMEFVRKALIDFYFKTDSDSLKSLIKSFHDGEFIEEELQEERAYYSEIESANQEVYDNFIEQLAENEEMELTASSSVYGAKVI